MAETPEMKPHAIMITLPFQGHLSPFVCLALKLASKGFRVTFINTEHVHHRITKAIITNNSDNGTRNVSDVDIFAEARDSAGLDIHYRTISDGFPLDYDREANAVEFWDSLLKDFPSILQDFVGEIITESSFSGGDDPSFFPVLVTDTLSLWSGAGEIAQKYKLVNVSFWTEPALVFATGYYIDLLIEHGHFPPKDDNNRYDNIDYIPGIESISRKDLPAYFNYEAAEAQNLVQRIVFRSFNEVKKADFILQNTVQELEPHVLSSLNQTQPTYSIGPTNFYKESRKTIVPKSLICETDCSKWLDAKSYRSVLYVSFGSLVIADKHVIEEIARGLVLSEANFLWITRNNHTDNNSTSSDEGVIFPLGFRDKVKDKGLIVPWCDQAAVLSHRAIGGFLTHCGWNSVLESAWFGVPMICYPIDYDQPTNRKLMVDDWKIGLNLCDEKETMSAEKIAEKIKKVMDMTEENELRREIEKVRKTLHHALDDDGSSERNFNRFVDDLKDKIHGSVSKLKIV